MSEVEGKLFIKIPFETDDGVITFAFDKTNVGNDVFDILLTHYTLKKEDYELKWQKDGSSTLTGFDNLFAYFGTEGRLHCVLNLKGGVLTRAPMNKTTALKVLKKRVFTKLNKAGDMNDEELALSIPEKLQDYIQSCEDAMADMKVLKSQNINLVKYGLKHATTDALNEAYAVLSKKGDGHRYSTEERVLKAFYPLFKTVKECNEATEVVKRAESRMVQLTMEFYIEHYATFNGAEATLTSEKFKKDICDELEKRADAVSVPTSTHGNCSVM
eukprot:Skav231675  [mRNA]  locus=scaffold597:348873:349688:+ [translate_table: standard]